MTQQPGEDGPTKGQKAVNLVKRAGGGLKNAAVSATGGEIGEGIGKLGKWKADIWTAGKKLSVGRNPLYNILMMGTIAAVLCSGGLRIGVEAITSASNYFGGNEEYTPAATQNTNIRTLDLMTNQTEVTCNEAGSCTIDAVAGGEPYHVITPEGWERKFDRVINGNGETDGANTSTRDNLELLIETATIEGEETEAGDKVYTLLRQGPVSVKRVRTNKLSSVSSPMGRGYKVSFAGEDSNVSLDMLSEAQKKDLANYERLIGELGTDVDTFMRYATNDERGVEAVDYVGIRVSGLPTTQTDAGYEITTVAANTDTMGRVIQLSAEDPTLNQDVKDRLTYALGSGSAVCSPILDIVLEEGGKQTTGESDAAVTRYALDGRVANVEFNYHDISVKGITNVNKGKSMDGTSGWFAQAQHNGQTYNLFFSDAFVEAQKEGEYELKENTGMTGLGFSTNNYVTAEAFGGVETYFRVTGGEIGIYKAPSRSRVGSGGTGIPKPDLGRAGRKHRPNVK
mgnify:CR=1 FL=1